MKKRSLFDHFVIFACLLLLTIEQHRKSVNAETRIKLPSDISFTHESSANIEGEMCYNLAKQMNGICTLPNECPEAITDFKKGIQPQICNYKGQLPIICCPRLTQSVAPTTPTKSSTLDQSASTSATYPHTHRRPTISSAATQKPTTYTTMKVASTTRATATTATTTWKRPTTHSGRRISAEKCKEYVKLTIEESVISTLSVIPEIHTVKTTKCRNAGSEGFIVGGTKTEPGEFPHMAVIGWKQSNTGEIAWNCGGSLISYRFVLSAAHCTRYLGMKPDVIRLGEQNLKRNDDGAKTQDFQIEQVIRHPDYRAASKYNDISLFKLNRDVKITEFVKPACLWQSFEVNYTSATAIGFGLTKDYGDQSDDLLKVSLHLIGNKRCNGFYEKSTPLIDGIIDSQICAGDEVEEKDTCRGDSGGPIQIAESSSACLYHIIGVTSFGKSCGSGYAVYTRVSQFLNWIEDIVWSGHK